MTTPQQPNQPAELQIEDNVCDDIKSRQQKGIAKYGMTVAENPLSLTEWLQHAYEECLDQSIYLKRAIREVINSNAAQRLQQVEKEKCGQESMTSMIVRKNYEIDQLKAALAALLAMDELEMGDESILEYNEPNHPVIVARRLLTKGD